MLQDMANDAAVARAKTRLAEGRDQILARHRGGAGGQEVVRAISALTDEVVTELFQTIVAQFPGSDAIALSLVATGGYGRRELAPRSDIDLLALLPREREPGRARANLVAEHLHRALWDAGLEAGYSSRARTTPSARRCSTAAWSRATRSCSRGSSAPLSPSWSSGASRNSSATSSRSSTSADAVMAVRCGCSSRT